MSTTKFALLAIAVAITLGTLALGFGPGTRTAGAQSGDLLMKVTPPEESVSKGDEAILVTISVENATNLGAFAFELEYDPDILEIALAPETDQPLIQRGDFLTSTGREAQCPEPESQRGVLRMLCTTLRMTPDGPDGNGTLATVTFKAIGSGATDLRLDKVQANNPDGTEIGPIDVLSASLDVKGDSGLNWLLFGIIAVAVAVVVGGAGFVVARMRK
jgi:hypothetical protein